MRHICTVTLFLGAFSSCQYVQKSIEETLAEEPAVKTQPVEEARETNPSRIKEQNKVSIFSDSALLQQVQNELMALPKFKGKAAKFYEDIHFYDFQQGRIALKMQDPDQPENLDEYVYFHGRWEAPKPVQVTGRGISPRGLMALKDIRFATAKHIFDVVRARADTIEGAGEVNHVYFQNSATFHTIEWSSYIQGARKNYSFYFTLEGKEKKK